MKENNFIKKKEHRILRFLTILTMFVTVISISSKLIGGYNRAIKEEFSSLERVANNSASFWISDCFSYLNHPSLFTLFLFFTFLFFLSARKFTNTFYLSAIAFTTLTLSLLQASYLSIWFSEIVRIEWNSTLILPDIFDGILYFCFAFMFVLQLKIIYRFTREKFQAKIS